MITQLFAISGLVNALIAIGFGFLVFSKDWRNAGGRLFLLMTVSLAVWGFGYWMWLTRTNYDEALFWVRFLAVGSLFIPVFFFHWVTVVLQIRHAVFLWVIYIGALIITAFSYTSLFIPTVSEKMIFPFWPDAGPLYASYFAGFYVFVIGYALILLIRGYFAHNAEERRGQILYILLGALLGFGGGLTNFPLWWNVPVMPYGTFLVAAFPFLLGYSIIKHHLFNLKAIAAELLVFFMIIVLAIEIFLSSTPLEIGLRVVFFIVVATVGTLLIRSVYNEVEQRQEIQRLADDLKIANEKLKELDKLKSQFLSIASHDLRAPLTIIRNFVSLLMDGTYGKLTSAAEEGLRQVFDRATDMAKSVDSYLNVSRIEQGRMKYDFIDVEFAPIIKKSVADFKPNADKKGIELLLTVSPELEGKKVRLDVAKINEVLNNLLDNSIKYTPKGSITITAEKTGNVARITLKDTGVGMSQTTIGKLFQLFSTGTESLKVNTSSTGVGLYITKAHVEAHGGKIWAESEGEGKGSTFILELPLLP